MWTALLLPNLKVCSWKTSSQICCLTGISYTERQTPKQRSRLCQHRWTPFELVFLESCDSLSRRDENEVIGIDLAGGRWIGTSGYKVISGISWCEEVRQRIWSGLAIWVRMLHAALSAPECPSRQTSQQATITSHWLQSLFSYWRDPNHNPSLPIWLSSPVKWYLASSYRNATATLAAFASTPFKTLYFRVY